jgi:hypothetical protein
MSSGVIREAIQIYNLAQSESLHLAALSVFSWTKFGQEFLPTDSVRRTLNRTNLGLTGQIPAICRPYRIPIPRFRLRTLKTDQTMLRSRNIKINHY